MKKTKGEIVASLSSVFRRYGFDGASISRLTAGTGLERASLYHYFPNGKTDMAEAVLLAALEDLSRQVVGVLRPVGDTELPPNRRLKEMLAALDKFYAGGNEICFVTIFSLGAFQDGEGLGHAATAAVTQALEEWRQLLQRTLSENKIKNPRRAAERALAAVQGGLVLGKRLHDAKFFKGILKSLAEEWRL